MAESIQARKHYAYERQRENRKYQLDINRGANVRKTGSGVGNLVSLKVFLGPGASFAPY